MADWVSDPRLSLSTMDGNRRRSGLWAAVVGGVVCGVMVVVLTWHSPASWWLMITAAVAGLGFGSRPILRLLRERSPEFRRRRRELKRHAEQQNQWVLRGDSRGIYGPDGAKVMSSVLGLPVPATPDAAVEAQDDVSAAAVVDDPDDIDQMLVDKPPGWRAAAFTSVLVQRRAISGSALLDAELGYIDPTGDDICDTDELGVTLTVLLAKMSETLGDLQTLADSAVFSVALQGSDEDGRPDDVVHIAHRFMDYHDQFLACSEVCRSCHVPLRYRGLQRDCALLLAIPLRGFREFIDELVKRVEEFPDVVRWAVGDVTLEPVMLEMPDDPKLRRRVFKQLDELRS